MKQTELRNVKHGDFFPLGKFRERACLGAW